MTLEGQRTPVRASYRAGFGDGKFEGIDEAQACVLRAAQKLRKRGLSSEAGCLERVAREIWVEYNREAK